MKKSALHQCKIGIVIIMLFATTHAFGQVEIGKKPLACQIMDKDAKNMVMQKSTHLRNVK